jgi:transposase
VRANDGRKLDRKALEDIRLQAVRQVLDGTRPEEIAQHLGLSRTAVFSWVAKYREGGEEALRMRKAPGRSPWLSAEDRRRLRALIIGRTPAGWGLRQALWTRQAVRDVVRAEFGRSVSMSSIGRLLQRMGLQPPCLVRAAGNQAASWVDIWYRERRPAVLGEGGGAGVTLYFSGQAAAPAPEEHGGAGDDPVATVCAVTPQGTVHFAAYRGTCAAQRFVDFGDRLLRDTPGRVVVAVERRPVVLAPPLAEFLASTGGRLQIV